MPSSAAREDAAAYVRRVTPYAEDVCWRVSGDVQFVDCGENFEAVHCPRCQTDLGEWWSLAMEVAHEQKFNDLRVTTPCCRLRTSLNKLEYAWPSGFARCVLEISEPGPTWLPEPSMGELQRLLGCSVRVIWAHY